MPTVFTADAEADVSFGLLTGSNLDLADRVYFDTSGEDASKVTIEGSANLGYDGGNGFDAHVKLAFFDFDIVGARAFLDASLVGSFHQSSSVSFKIALGEGIPDLHPVSE